MPSKQKPGDSYDLFVHYLDFIARMDKEASAGFRVFIQK